MPPDKSPIELYFNRLDVCYELHGSSIVETWLRYVGEQKVGVVWYDRVGKIWAPRNPKADKIIQDGDCVKAMVRSAE